MNPLNTRRLAFKMNLLTKYLMKQIFWLLVLVFYTVYIIAIIIAYLDPNSGFSLILCIFWSLIFLVLLLQLFGFVVTGFVMWVLSALYLKYKFYEINGKILKSFRFMNNSLLLNAINEHNSISEQTKQLNELFSLSIFLLYFIATPALMISMYLVNEKDTNYYMRFVFGFLFSLIFSIVF